MATYDRMRYWTTHNSYEGGPRGSVPAQLTENVRSVELDIWDNDFERVGDYRLGHFKPGHAVALGAGAPGDNPSTLLLRDWLRAISDWSTANDHAVITLVLDVKSDLTDNESGGDLEDFNATLEKAFGSRLFTRDDFDELGAWPESSVLRNRIICVLSGNANTRASYRFCSGERPAIAVQQDGKTVIAYRSGAGDMRYWSGQAKLPIMGKPGGVVWRRKGTYAWSPYTVSEPSLAMVADGWIASVYRVGPAPGKPGPALLACTVGQLLEDGWIDWHGSDTFGKGILPTLESAGDGKVRLVHKTDTGKSLRVREGKLNRKKAKIDWAKAESTEGPAFANDTVTWKGHALHILTNAAGLLLCAFDGTQRAVGYRQLAFVELQNEEPMSEFVDPVFYGASASSRDAIISARKQGLVARAWWFKDEHCVLPPHPPQENFAASDQPFGVAYGPYMAAGDPADV